MRLLKPGSKGKQVAALQTKLNSLGFDAGKADGKFGPRTKAAVIAFQKSHNLRADGVAGPKTLAAIDQIAGPNSPGPEPKPTLVPSPQLVARMFPETPLSNIEENLPFVLDALKEADLADRDMLLMALATIRAETAHFTPLSEFKSKYNTSPGGKAFDRYDKRKDLGNQGPPDGINFRGRGYIQLTGRSNYQLHGAAIGLGDQLVENPALANEPLIAARLLASFLKSKEYEIRKALAARHLRNARKLVNGGTHGLKVFVETFKIGERLF
jgi:peptidoglycan hydrolase-like protein with peptidoglycan-binding domain